ncbi:RIP metalloprotease RseP [Candidatus Pantoea edessiphila]|uniref:Zinc metalloprotease n=1 Tax=Candidatus Pantoea edessiphila TaxID=2044610 RepID=A0A2P5SWD6_9GAMM|nr:RIP metalloprotease RseP [Candidatus Pantoea edessiphila]PPI86626.1 RIP metalloprotease RseP [Candidatus Pantoea edessiphila]
MLNMIWNIAVFVLTFSILVTVHELGHFCAARFYGVKVNRFSIGFGKSIFKCSIYDTEFVIALVPFGGYIKMLDERTDHVPVNLINKAFNRKSIWQRTVIVLAGSLANLILAVFLYSIVFIKGTISFLPVIGKVVEESIAEKLNIQPGMEIKKIDNIETPDWNIIRTALISKMKNNSIILTLVNTDKNITYKKEINLKTINFDVHVKDPLILLGIIPLYPKINFIVTKINNGIKTNANSLKQGDIITKLNNQLLFNTQYFLDTIKISSNNNKDLQLEINRNNRTIKLKTKSDKIVHNNSILFLTPKIIYPKNYILVQKYNVFNAFSKAIIKTWQIIKLITCSIFSLISGNLQINHLNGPIAIAKGASLSAKAGIIYYLLFLCLISINLSIFNLFPLPMLDGGHLLFLLLEKIQGKPLADQIQNILSWVGFSILMILIIFALSNDFSNFMRN